MLFANTLAEVWKRYDPVGARSVAKKEAESLPDPGPSRFLTDSDKFVPVHNRSVHNARSRDHEMLVRDART